MTDQGNSREVSSAAERRWRRTVDVRGEVKLKAARLLRDFGYTALEDPAIDAIEARLASVGLMVEPDLRTSEMGSVVSLTTSLEGPTAAPPAAPVAPPPAPGPAPAAAPVEQAPAPLPSRATVPPPPDLTRTEGTESLVQAENRRLLEERSEVERRLQARTEELREARRGQAVLGDTIADTRVEVRRTAAELQFALTGLDPAAEPEPEPDAEPEAAEDTFEPETPDAETPDAETPDAEAGAAAEADIPEPEAGPPEQDAEAETAEREAVGEEPDRELGEAEDGAAAASEQQTQD